MYIPRYPSTIIDAINGIRRQVRFSFPLHAIYTRKKEAEGAERGKESARVRIRSARVVKDGVVTREGRGDFLVYTRLHLITISFLIYLISKILGAQGFSAE